METHLCLKYNGPLDEGRISLSGSDYIAYLSNNQTGAIRMGAMISCARACPNCGYVEMYLDPKELKPGNSR